MGTIFPWISYFVQSIVPAGCQVYNEHDNSKSHTFRNFTLIGTRYAPFEHMDAWIYQNRRWAENYTDFLMLRTVYSSLCKQSFANVPLSTVRYHSLTRTHIYTYIHTCGTVCLPPKMVHEFLGVLKTVFSTVIVGTVSKSMVHTRFSFQFEFRRGWLWKIWPDF